MIQIKNLHKVFEETQNTKTSALEDITLHIKKGELCILKGISGSGKSTLLSLIATLEKPTSGSIIIDKKPIAKLPDLHASSFRLTTIGFIFQAYHLFENLSVFENITTPLIPMKLSHKEITDKVLSAMELANITHKKDAKVSTLSGGEKQRCAIARALVNDPNIILCDEPTANLDHQNRELFIENIKALKLLGKTIIIATHDPYFDTLEFVDRTIHIEAGKIL